MSPVIACLGVQQRIEIHSHKTLEVQSPTRARGSVATLHSCHREKNKFTCCGLQIQT